MTLSRRLPLLPKRALTRSRAHTLTCPALLALLLSGCGLAADPNRIITGSGRVAAEERPVSGIQAVALRGQGEVVITQGAVEGVTVEAEDNLLPLITTVVDGGTLELGFNRANWDDTIRPTRPIRFQVAVRDLEALDLSGTGSISLVAAQAPGEFAITLSGAGTVSVDRLAAEALRVALSGAGDVVVGGRVNAQSAALSGKGNYLAGDLESQSAEVDLSGAGDMLVWAEQSLDIRLSGVGSVSYFGLPSVTRSISGQGDINPKGSK